MQQNSEKKLMKTQRTWKQLLDNCLLIALACGTIGIAIKFTTYFGNWVYFPAFPNSLDSAFLIFSVLYLVWKVKK
jgi:hypothetical protein